MLKFSWKAKNAQKKGSKGLDFDVIYGGLYKSKYMREFTTKSLTSISLGYLIGYISISIQRRQAWELREFI